MNNEQPMFSIFITWNQDYIEHRKYLEQKIEEQLVSSDYKEAIEVINNIKNKK